MNSFIRRVLGRAQPNFPWNNREPIREELFSVERIEEHARSLAIAQPIAPQSRRGHPLAGRLSDNSVALRDAYRRIARAANENLHLEPASPIRSRFTGAEFIEVLPERHVHNADWFVYAVNKIAIRPKHNRLIPRKLIALRQRQPRRQPVHRSLRIR